MTEFKQKKGFSTKKHYLYEDKIIVESKTLQQFDKYEVKLDKLGFEIQYQAENTTVRSIFIIGCVATLLFITGYELFYHNINNGHLAVYYFCILFLLGMALIKEPIDSIFLVGGEKNLVFFRTSPSEKEVLSFIETVISATKNKLKNKYLSPDETVPDEEYIPRLQWLKENEIITKKEFENLKKDFEIDRLL